MDVLSYKERIKKRDELKSLIDSIELKTSSFKNNFQSYKENDLKDEISASDKKETLLKGELKTLENSYSKIFDNINKKVVTNDRELLDFLKEHNSVQRNSIKRFFGIEKKFIDISNKDKKVLMPILKAQFDEKILSKESEISKNIEVSNSLKSSLENLKDLDRLDKMKSYQSVNENKITQMEQPIKDFIEKIIDLDLNSIKKSFSEKNISIEDVLLYIKNLLSSKVNEKGEKAKNEKLFSLEKDLKKVQKENDKDVSTNIKSGVGKTKESTSIKSNTLTR